MPKIHPLSKQVAELIAAGEVVERPASVVKELVENAIDAGAKHVTLEIRNGGLRYIRITDDGCGIAKEDVRSAFLSHATSKIRSAEDLDAIATLGFRGEALASIAAVAKVELLTRTAEEESGTRCVIEGGGEVLLDDAGCPVGTTILVRDLFYNTPARMKFLKKDVSEANAVAGVMDRLALSNPAVSFRFLREEKQTLLTPGDGDLRNTAYAVFGREFAEGLLPAAYSLEGVRVEGFLSKPDSARPNRNMQLFFLNGRLVKTGTASAALSEAYKNSLPNGKFPACILHIYLANALVDVNVHPAKLEVRFADEKAVFQAVYHCAKNTLFQDDTRPQMHITPQPGHISRLGMQKPPPAKQLYFPEKRPDFWKRVSAEEFLGGGKKEPPSVGLSGKSAGGHHTISLNAPPAEIPSLEEEPSTVPTLTFFIPPEPAEPVPHEAVLPIVESLPLAEAPPPVALTVGEVFRTYIIVEREDSLLFIDKHAAHERMLYEKLKASREPAAQVLLSPIAVTLSKEEYAAVLEQTEAFRQAGFEVTDFGTGTVLVRECPMELAPVDVEAVLGELAGMLLEHRQELLPEKLERIYHSVACHSALRAGDFTTPREREQFVEQLLALPDIRHCPHGRPVCFELTRRELEKYFGRG